MTNCIVVIYDERKNDNDVTDCTGSLYAKNETKLSCLIWHDTVYNEHQIGRRHD